jgi:hypothetical protein
MSPQAGWLLVNEIVPRLKSSIATSVRPVGCEDMEELVQDGTAIAATMLHSAETQGKQVMWRGMSKLNDIHLGFLLGSKKCG